MPKGHFSLFVSMKYIKYLKFRANLVSITQMFRNETNLIKISLTDSMTKWYILNSKIFSMYVRKVSFSLKQGWIHGNPVADGWAGAVMRKPLGIQKCDGPTDRPTDRHGKV